MTITLSLSPHVYAKLSPHAFLSAHLPTSRPSGRAPTQTRSASLHTGSLTHAHGSAVVRLGDNAVVCGIRGEILRVEDASVPSSRTRANLEFRQSAAGGEGGRRDSDVIADLGLLVPNVELSTGCHPSYLPGAAPSTLAQSLSQRVLTLLRISDLVGLERLQIYERDSFTTVETTSAAAADMPSAPSEDAKSDRTPRAYWTLHITLLFISLCGSPFDAAWLALLAALRDVRLPDARWDRDADGVLCDSRPENYRALGMRGLPVPLNWRIFIGRGNGDGLSGGADGGVDKKSVILLDPDDFEESCCDEGGCVVVDCTNAEADVASKMIRVEMGGGGSLGSRGLREILPYANERWDVWKGLLEGINAGAQEA